MKKHKLPLYHWDTSIFITWLINEPRDPEEMAGVAGIATEIHRGHAKLITCETTFTEVLEIFGDLNLQQKMEQLFKRPNVVRVSIDSRVSELAGRIRYFYQNHSDPKEKRKIKTPDSQHLASAILYKVSELHTFDSRLIGLNGDVLGHNLTICKPNANQFALNL